MFWQIVIDDCSLEKYAELKGPIGTRVRNSIDWDTGCFLQAAHRCAMLDDNGLCDLQREAGEQALCETCRIYPRHTEEYEDVREYSLSLSCPEAARRMLTRPDSVRFTEWDTEEEDPLEEFDFLLYDRLVYAREYLYRIAQDRTLPLSERLEQIRELGQVLQNCLDEGRVPDMDRVVEDCAGTFAGRKEIDRSPAGCFEDEKALFLRLYEMERLRPEWEGILNTVRDAAFSDSASFFRLRKKAEELGEELAPAGEQILMFFLYVYFCGAVYDGEIRAKTGLAVYSVRWIFLIAAAAMEKEPETPHEDLLIRAAWKYARETEHSDVNLEKLLTILC